MRIRRIRSLRRVGARRVCSANGRRIADPPQQDVYLDDLRLDVAPFIPQNAGPVLDVGCGKGGFGRTLRDALGPQVRTAGIVGMRL